MRLILYTIRDDKILVQFGGSAHVYDYATSLYERTISVAALPSSKIQLEAITMLCYGDKVVEVRIFRAETSTAFLVNEGTTSSQLQTAIMGVYGYKFCLTRHYQSGNTLYTFLFNYKANGLSTL